MTSLSTWAVSTSYQTTMTTSCSRLIPSLVVFNLGRLIFLALEERTRRTSSRRTGGKKVKRCWTRSLILQARCVFPSPKFHSISEQLSLEDIKDRNQDISSDAGWVHRRMGGCLWTRRSLVGDRGDKTSGCQCRQLKFLSPFTKSVF